MSSGCRCHMMGRTCLTPAVHELSARDREFGTHIGIAEGEDRSGLVLTLRHNELEVAVLVLCNSQIGHRAYRGIELCQITAAYLTMEYFYDLHGGLMCQRDVRIAGSGVADDADVLIEINGVHLGQLSHTGNGLQNGHCHGNFHVTFYRTCGALLDQHGKCGDQHGIQFSGYALCLAGIVGSDHA